MDTKDTIKALIGMGFSAAEALNLVGLAVGESVPTLQSPTKASKVNPFLADGNAAMNATDAYAPIFPATGEIAGAAPAIKRRRRRRYHPRVGYVLTKLAKQLSAGGGTAKQKAAFADLYPVAADVLKAIAKAKGGQPLHNRAIETASGHGRKSVESSVYQLRHFGLIESQPLETK